MMRIREALIVTIASTVVAASAPGWSWAAPRSARKHVRDGIQKHLAGDFEAAADAFAKAAEVLPEDARVAYDQACALAAQGKNAEATELFRSAANSREAGLVAASHYNLGCLAAHQAKVLFKGQPAEATPEMREQGLNLLRQAVRHYRDCLRGDPEHEAARRNLEVLRLWIKNMQDVWAQRDRQKRREEMDLLEFLQWIEDQQRILESTTKGLASLNPSPRQRQAVSQTEQAQRALAEEMSPLQQKIEAALQGPEKTGAGNQLDDRSKAAAIETTSKMTGRAETSMLAAANDLAVRSMTPAIESQATAIDELNDVYRFVAPYQQLLQKAISTEEALVGTTVGVLDEEVPDDAVDRELLSRDQRFVSTWTETLMAKAEVELMRTQTVSGVSEESDQASQQHQAALQQSYQKALELGPQIVDLSQQAAENLNSGDWQNARPKQEESLRLLKEIAAKMPPQEQQQQDDQEQSDQDQQQDQQQDQKQQESEDEKKPDEQNQQKQEDQQQKQSKENERQRKMPQRQAESLLRKVRQRERDYRERQKQLQRLLQGTIPVDRDW